jgi:MFS family permease
MTFSPLLENEASDAPVKRNSWAYVIADEIGLVSLFKSSWDVHLLIFMRFARLFAFGQASIFLALFFKEHGIDESKTGLFMSATLAGDVLISYFLTLYADRIGRKKTLCIGAIMMVFSGIVFSLSGNFYLLLFAAVVGVISPSGNEIGPFRAIEESTLAHLVPLDHRPDIYAWYVVLGALGASFGSMVGGYTIELAHDKYGFTLLEAYKLIFAVYSILGFVKLVATLLLSKHAESEMEDRHDTTVTETSPLLQDPNAKVAEPVKPKQSRLSSLLHKVLPELSHESRGIVLQLSILFALDSFASSLTTISWISYYVSQKFDLKQGILGSVFFITGIICSFASLGGSSISKRLGPLLTMVVTHLPSSTLLALIPIPRSFHMTMALLIIRSCTSTMDVAPRQAFLSMVVLKRERTAVMGWINIVKTLAQVCGPSMTGVLTKLDKQWICFVAAGSLKVLYDLGILGTFLKIKYDREHD